VLYLVAAGEFDVSIGGRYVRTVAPCDGFGEIALLPDGIRTATVAARGPGILYSFERAPFLEAVTGSSHAHRVVEDLVAGRLDTTL
jgi:CRP-like cAMP-binding protein